MAEMDAIVADEVRLARFGEAPSPVGELARNDPAVSQSSNGSPARPSIAVGALSATPGEVVSVQATLRLLAWLSPAFPVGGFSYSHGLEWAIEDRTVADAASLAAWIAGVLADGAGRSDAILFAAVHRAAQATDRPALARAIELAAAFQPSRERHLEATAQGHAFLSTIAAAWPCAAFAELVGAIRQGQPVTYAAAVALAAAAHAVPLVPALNAYLAAFAANLVSAGIRAIPIGQTDGQRIVASLAPLIETLAGLALASNLDELGGAALRADIASMKHETQYTRLFRS